MGKKSCYAIEIAMLLTAAGSMAPVYGQTEEGSSVEKVVVTGSRSQGRSVEESSAPIDYLLGDDLVNQGDGDLANLLRNTVPSFSANPQPISDASTLVRPINLRGLPPDSTLVLVNGKRRHRAAVINFLGQGISDGAQGPDISVIPAIALESVEVLRDGAAAQYGSDAIAGVINFRLKDSDEGGVVAAKYGSYYEGDGDSIQYSGNFGVPILENGFANFSFEFRQAEATDRSVQRDDAAGLIANGNTFVADPAQIWGQPEVKEDTKLFLNMGFNLDANTQLYAFGNYAQREVEGGFYFRNPQTRDGVYSNDSGETLLVADANPNNQITCPTIAVGDATSLNSVSDNSTALGAECFTFNEMFPGGFTPRFGGNVWDSSGVTGLRGNMGNLNYDLSTSLGVNTLRFFMKNTVNASLGPNTPTEFEPGGYSQREQQVNLDLSLPVSIGLASDVNIAFGFEQRTESFEILAGNYESYAAGLYASQGFSIGSNGFPGISPDIEGQFSRKNAAAYLDMEASVTDKLNVGLAGRAEEFEDFGSTTNSKASLRYAFTNQVAVRSTVSTGFRAPTPGQANVTNITTVLENGKLVNRGTIPPTNPIALLKGGKELKPETSVNLSVGSVFTFGKLFSSIDYFRIDVKDRIAQSASKELSPEEATDLESQGVAGASNLNSFRFYTNDFDTQTQGIDLVVNYPVAMFGGSTAFNLAANWTDTKVVSYDEDILDDTRIRQLEDALPEYRSNLGMIHYNGDWRSLLRLNYFSGFYEAHLDSGELPIEAGDEYTVDVEFSYKTAMGLALAIGAQNLLNEYPDEHDYQGVAGAKYPETSPLGFNGGYYYSRLSYYF